jgi:hypothetical protein
MGVGESLDGGAIVGLTGLHLNKRIQKPVPFSNQQWMLGGRGCQWLEQYHCKVRFAVSPGL